MTKRGAGKEQDAPIAAFSIARLAFLDADAALSAELPEWATHTTTLKRLLHGMEAARRFDARAVALQRTGQLGTYAAALGQEAVSLGVADAMRERDVMLPTYRESAAQIARGVAMSEILRYWGGDERGSDFAACRADFPVCVPIASQLPHAAGVAFALKRRGEGGVAVVFVGDGGTSKGDFYEAINVAGAWGLPMVVIVNNNQWAISVARKAQSGAQTLAQKAIAAGIDGMQVDGNDVIAVREATLRALHAAEDRHEPTLIEAVTYRLGDHTTADDASRYRNDDEVAAARHSEPIARLQRYLVAQGALDDAAIDQMHTACDKAVEEAVRAYQATPVRNAESLLDHVYAEMPESLSSAVDLARRGPGAGR